jgi:hypothetical protein
LLGAHDAVLLDEQHGVTVGYRIEAPEHRIDELRRALTDATAGDLLFDVEPDEPAP